MAANNTQPDWRSESIFTPEQQQFFNRIVIAVVLVGLGIWIGSLIFSGNAAQGYATNIYTEILSVAVTVGILDYLNRRRDEQERVKELKTRLVREAGGQSNEMAKSAVDKLRVNGWLTGAGSLLRNAYLFGANLQEAHLYGADLSWTDCTQANLMNARLNGANLENARLVHAYLFDAIVPGANLKNADLTNALSKGAIFNSAQLQGAVLKNTDLRQCEFCYSKLQGADLTQADLENAFFTEPHFDTNTKEYLLTLVFDTDTILPDGSKWTPEIDMTRFTDPNHPDFWRSDDPGSYAYKAKTRAVRRS